MCLACSSYIVGRILGSGPVFTDLLFSPSYFHHQKMISLYLLEEVFPFLGAQMNKLGKLAKFFVGFGRILYHQFCNCTFSLKIKLEDILYLFVSRSLQPLDDNR